MNGDNKEWFFNITEKVEYYYWCRSISFALHPRQTIQKKYRTKNNFLNFIDNLTLYEDSFLFILELKIAYINFERIAIDSGIK